MLFSPCCALHAALSMLRSPCCPLHAVHFMLCPPCCALHAVLSMLYRTWCAQYAVAPCCSPMLCSPCCAWTPATQVGSQPVKQWSWSDNLYAKFKLLSRENVIVLVLVPSHRSCCFFLQLVKQCTNGGDQQPVCYLQCRLCARPPYTPLFGWTLQSMIFPAVIWSLNLLLSSAACQALCKWWTTDNLPASQEGNRLVITLWKVSSSNFALKAPRPLSFCCSS